MATPTESLLSIAGSVSTNSTKKRVRIFRDEIPAVLSGSSLLEGGSDDEGASAEAQGRAIIEVLGREKRDEVLAALYMVRTDVSLSVRQGVCIGLSGVMASAGKNQLLSFMDELIPTIRTALSDSMPEVREAAGLAFNTLYKSAGMQAIDEIVPTLLRALEDDQTSDTALDGLKQILSVRISAVLPHVLPKLVHLPLTAFNAHALGAVAEVAGPGLNPHLGTVLPALLSAMGADEKEIQKLAKEAAETVVLVIDEEGVESLISKLVRAVSDSQASIRRSSSYLIGYFFKNSKLYLVDEAPNVISTLIVLLSDSDSATVAVSWEALSRVVSSVPKECRIVRSSAALALGKLSALSTRVDPLVADLLSSLQAPDSGVREASLSALEGVLKHAGKSVSSAVRTRLYLQLKDLIHHDDDQVRISAAGILGVTSLYLEDDQLTELLQELSDFPPSLSLSARHGSVLTISSMLRHNPSTICLSPEFPSILDRLKGSLIDEKFPLRETSTKAFGKLLIHKLRSDPSNTSLHLEIISSLVSALRDDSSEVRRKALSAIKRGSKENASVILARINIIGPALAECLKDGSTPVRLAAERCALHAFQLSKGPENVQAAQKFITGLDARRISKLPENSDDSEDGEDTASG